MFSFIPGSGARANRFVSVRRNQLNSNPTYIKSRATRSNPRSTPRENQPGFTLIEVAIVLAIVGLVLGGIQKGQELVNLAMAKKLQTDFRNIPLFIYSYQDKFRALPGDDPNANSHVGGIVAAQPSGEQGNGAIGGNWNSTNISEESLLFWQHIRLAGFAPGSTVPEDQANWSVNAMGGKLGVQSGTASAENSPLNGGPGLTNPIRGAYIICSDAIYGKYVKHIDAALDDGNTATGTMMATPTSGYSVGSAVATPTADIDDAVTYTVCMGA